MQNKDEKHSSLRGAEWRQWDLHIHTPASFHWDGGNRFDSNPDSTLNKKLVDEMIGTMNGAAPAVFAIMDYWTFDGWFALKKRLKDTDVPEFTKKVFPGIELRLVSPTECRLNAHAIFSDETSDQILKDFLSGLELAVVNRPLSPDALVELARKVGEDKLKHHNFKKSEVDKSYEAALLAGSTIAEITCESYKEAIKKVPNGQVIGFMPFNTSDGLDEVKWEDHYAYFLGLFESSPIFETRTIALRDAFVMEETPSNKDKQWFRNFKHGLKNVPRLAISGSDAHRFVGIKGNNDKRGYGDFPSNKITWIKADPTFLGLLQAIKEPAQRSFIGERPEKMGVIEQNKTYFIDCVEIAKDPASKFSGTWLDGCKVFFNPDLVAIIGNKGSGKSALVDIIALLGNSRQKEHFSFLKKDRFYGKSGEPAKHFTGTIKWLDNETAQCKLSDTPSDTKVELVRYIPQGHFENVCNDHASGGRSFQKELEAVIFDHAGDDIRLGAYDFEQLKEQQESGYRDKLGECRKNLSRLNLEIENIEIQLQPKIKKSLEEQLILKRKQIKEHEDIKPIKMEIPSGEVSDEEQKVSEALGKNTERLKEIDEIILNNTTTDANFAAKLKAINSIRDRQQILEKQLKQFRDDTEKDFENLGIKLEAVYSLTLNKSVLNQKVEEISQSKQLLLDNSNKLQEEKKPLLEQQLALKAKLNEPQLLYQQNLKLIEGWEGKLNELTGTPEIPETLKGIEKRISQLDDLPASLKEKINLRKDLTGEIFDILDEQRRAREKLFKPVQDLIQNNDLIREEFKLQFQATLGAAVVSMISTLFALIKNATGDFRGEDESRTLVIKLFEKYDHSIKSDLLSLIEELNIKIHEAAGGSDIEAMLRKDKKARDVYDLLYGLSYIEPRYSLLFQETQIEQLSPGQRGALLLIFYLLVDKGRNPIILDQPEENLDNETVFNLLVPVLSQAKKRRQVIMVTHNPNLAVVCDAEQIIYSSFNRKNSSRIEYISGSIENPVINQCVVNVLEGTKPAFNNRKGKYHPDKLP